MIFVEEDMILPHICTRTKTKFDARVSKIDTHYSRGVPWCSRISEQ